MHIGVMLTEQTGPDAFDRVRDDVRRAVDDGFASAWMTQIFGLDTLTALAVAGSQVPGIELGTSVVPIYPRHPAALAQQALTVALAVGGRLTLGIGVSHKITTEGMYGYSFDRPARHMSEYLSVLLPLLQGEPVDFTGETVAAHLALAAPPTPVPVLLAALAPRMLRLAGERADGTALWMTGPTTIRDYVVPTIRAAAEAAGRAAPRVVCSLPVCVTDDPAAARARAAKSYQVYGTLPSYRAVLDREGAAGPADVAVIGDEDTAAAKIAAIADAGATDFVAAVFGRGDEEVRTRALVASLSSS
jgi:5,10-methylenetetrahydromethanopterin reductase